VPQQPLQLHALRRVRHDEEQLQHELEEQLQRDDEAAYLQGIRGRDEAQ
jgi:hypothetical protein